MNRAFKSLCIVSTAWLGLSTLDRLAQSSPSQSGKSSAPAAVRGADLPSSNEKADFCARMQAASTPEECREIARRMRDVMHTCIL
ncbi:hypothetical protein [Cupriavidus sp. D39]|uniref:hypothetical protein n=1 Tax=Cupriavidus sp. D39 TaxID=2997877 RepID=UPI00226F4C1A|nr:hypothetical protein [Cupriavidus sp. D39]MCY0853564.1 hypothetical protein [Cupriavidus sp. D39]